MNNYNIILIDSSYYTYYKFYSIIKWYSLHYPDEFKKNLSINEYNWLNDENFMEKYKKMYFLTINNIIKKVAIINYKIIFCMDSKFENLWRYKLYPNYKIKRKDTKKIYYNNVFEYTYNILIPELLNDNIHMIKINELEADDLIASITMNIKSKNTNTKIYIISNDYDFLQLGDENIFFIDGKMKITNISKETAADILHKKIIYGDVSDCIPGLSLKGYKIKKADLLNKNILIKFLEESDEGMRQYELNKKLIDFNHIPKKYYSIVINICNKLILI